MAIICAHGVKHWIIQNGVPIIDRIKFRRACIGTSMQSDERLANILECCHAADYIMMALVSLSRMNEFVP